MTIFLALSWVIVSGTVDRYTIVGIVCSLIISTCMKHYNLSWNVNLFKIKYLEKIKFFASILYSFLASTVQVLSCIWGISSISPAFMRINFSSSNNMKTAIFNNLITFTPGTTSIMNDKDVVNVHLLQKKNKNGVYLLSELVIKTFT
ncbi:MAG: hypothetical protein P857_148 [Candidatus Xenolissoclinum pacificiensis L6]|uniref:Na+/H+ ion antiporter subunit n=1 Tax=Candidatus Xenolissoclinum pacificiensis L6 TaxID=1401685 RepID=W2V0T3_9RICK|nr:MAG: hypothetical protein P857_148 [Candidatus Xenolissoclinum pacificiensis L6]